MSMAIPLRKTLEGFVVKIFIWLVEKALKASSRKYTKLLILCDVACFVEVWTKIADGKPVDTSDKLYSQINEAIEFYLFKDGFSRQEYGLFESDLLTWHFSKSIVSKYSEEKLRRSIDLFCITGLPTHS